MHLNPGILVKLTRKVIFIHENNFLNSLKSAAPAVFPDAATFVLTCEVPWVVGNKEESRTFTMRTASLLQKTKFRPCFASIGVELRVQEEKGNRSNDKDTGMTCLYNLLKTKHLVSSHPCLDSGLEKNL